MRAPSWIAIAAVGACRLGFEAVPAVGAGEDAPVIDAPPGATQIRVGIVGQGAITAPGLACTGACVVDAAAPLTLQATPWEGWELTEFSAPCGASSTCVAAPGATVTATFARAPITANRVFVTSTTLSTNIGLVALDAACVARAAAAGMTGDFIAFVSTAAVQALDRLAGSRGWVRLDGLPFLDQITDLGRADQARAISLTEAGVVFQAGPVHTGSTATGLRTANTCADWTSASAALTVDGASPNQAGVLATGNGGASCGMGSFFCFERGRVVPVSFTPIPFPAGRIVFTTLQTLSVGAGGPAAADAQCAAEATAANLPGTYRAVLATTTEDASTRIGGLAGPWRRADGAGVAWGSLDQRPLEVSLGMTAGGTVRVATAWLGARSLTEVGTTAETCFDYAVANAFTPRLLQVTSLLGTSTSASTPQACGTRSYPVLCAQLP